MKNHSRRQLFKFMASSPLFCTGASLSAAAQFLSLPAFAAQRLDDRNYLPASAEQAVNVFDMENVAMQNWNQAHWTYISQGVDDELTLKANEAAYKKLYLRARRLIDVSKIDTSLELFGTRLASPILAAPVGGLGMAHNLGDIEVAAGVKLSGHKMVYSTAATFGIEDVVDARGESVWYQLYPTNDWTVTQGLLRRAEAAGSEVVFLTVDIPARNQDRMRRFDQSSDECQACHNANAGFGDKAMMAGLDFSAVTSVSNPAMDWDYVKKLKDSTTMKLVIKGITLAEDASFALNAGVDGIVVSNHGGRADESGYGTIESLPEVVAAIQGKIPVLVDGGIRRGTDIVKALALGADAVLVGRPYVWGLGAFGRAGVAQVFNILDQELEIAMRQAGTPSLQDITAQSLR